MRPVRKFVCFVSFRPPPQLQITGVGVVCRGWTVEHGRGIVKFFSRKHFRQKYFCQKKYLSKKIIFGKIILSKKIYGKNIFVKKIFN